MNGGQVLHVVYAHTDLVDSLWTCRDAAEGRVAALNAEWKADYAYMQTYYANVPNGYCSNLGG